MVAVGFHMMKTNGAGITNSGTLHISQIIYWRKVDPTRHNPFLQRPLLDSGLKINNRYLSIGMHVDLPLAVGLGTGTFTACGYLWRLAETLHVPTAKVVARCWQEPMTITGVPAPDSRVLVSRKY